MNFRTNLVSVLVSLFKAFVFTNFNDHSISIIKNQLLEGNLLSAEQSLKQLFQALESECIQLVITKLCQDKAIQCKLKASAKTQGLKHFTLRKTTLRLASGLTINFKSWYAQTAPKGYNGSRNLFHLYFKTVHKSSPLHTSNVSSTSVICPSFEVAADMMTELGIPTTSDWQRDVTASFAEKCRGKHAELILKPGENLAGKTVLIAIDGGRCRTRQPNGSFSTKNDRNYEQYNTPWIEPKLFVISTIDENGQTNKIDLPIFDATFGDDELFELLRTYLVKLEIHKAKTVQVAADGAPWIWNRVRPFLLTLGVDNERIIETLDYYHAREHLTTLTKYLPADKQESSLASFQQLLWDGDIAGIKTKLKDIFPDLETNPLKPFDYFEKNATRMNYKYYKENNLVCGSGIIESGIRRVLNLRFKCPSAFWKPENVEPLIFLRAAFLSKRWEYLQNNFYNI
jgi:hypothetical protein